MAQRSGALQTRDRPKLRRFVRSRISGALRRRRPILSFVRPAARCTASGTRVENLMDVLMPQLGETVAEGKISTWYKSVGEPVKPGDNLFEIETDKVSMEVPAITAGVLAEIRVPAGETAPV